MGIIESTLKESLIRLSKQECVGIHDIRVKIYPIHSREGMSVGYILMSKTQILKELTLRRILDIGAIDIFGKEKIVDGFMKRKLTELTEQKGVENINVRVFMKANNEPSLYLFDGGKAISELTDQDLD